jgi:radical SAM superfamily enzyme YgiQ (UPF0313 family)
MPTRPVTFCGLTAVHPDDHDQYPPLCFAYLSSYARRHAPHVRVIVARDAAEAIAARPDVVGISASSVNFSAARRLARQIGAALPAPVLLGGVHVSALPHTLPPEFAAGVIGEGERTFIDLMHAYAANGRFEVDALARIAGLAFHDGPRVRVTPRRELIADLAEVPPPDRGVLPGDFTRAHVVSSRGCPYECRFCASKKLWGPWRPFPVDHVLAELDDLIVSRGATEIHFFDDLFAADLIRLTALTEAIVARGYAGRVRFSCAIRAELAREAVFRQLARLGVRQLTFGAESQSPRVLHWLKGGQATPDANQRALDLAQQHGMTCRPSFIKGVPGETGDDLLATYDFLLRGIRERKIDYFEMHCLTPFPGTEIWNVARDRGLVREDMDFDELRVPWERLYLNETRPKTSFYFFENLTAIATRWLGLSERRLIGLIDVSHGAERLDECVAMLRAQRFLDAWHVLVFHGTTEVPALRGRGHEAGGRELLAPYLAAADPSLMFVYLRPDEGLDADALQRIVWWHFDREADLTLHSPFRHFAPASPFEQSLAVGNIAGLRAGLEAFTGEPGALDRLRAAGSRVAFYRPDDDPFTNGVATTRFFAQTLQREFRIDRPWPGREKMWQAVDERIVTDAARLPAREARRRRMRDISSAAREAVRRLFGRRRS